MAGIKVKLLPEVPNICNQILREVWKSEDVSVAYVEMPPGNISLLHQHSTFTELYYILDGKGTMWVGDEEFLVDEDTLVGVKPGVSHKLENTGGSILRHLVVSSPAFNPDDVELIDE
ncbi:MAG: cupin domain-containing protein [Candidatus Omnitrophica bacterium]|nr:cupin domain-containing protein [Candidatus Omnitrophota bacterium]